MPSNSPPTLTSKKKLHSSKSNESYSKQFVQNKNILHTEIYLKRKSNINFINRSWARTQQNQTQPNKLNSENINLIKAQQQQKKSSQHHSTAE